MSLLQYMNEVTTYGIQKTIVAIHTEDRDVTKFATPTQFEVDLPVSYKNVVSLRLSDIQLPTPLYVFSRDNQNTKLSVEVGGTVYTVEISTGTYTPAQLTAELGGLLTAATGSTFRVLYNQISRQLVFTNETTPFQLLFNRAEQYTACSAPPYYGNYSNWGLGSNLGFEKRSYSSDVLSFNFFWANPAEIFTSVHAVVAPRIANLDGDDEMYMEVATYNSIDEMQPYQERSSDLYYGKYGGNHNGSFARIPVLPRSTTQDYLNNIYFRDPPLERLQKLRFLFRYHDGRPVNFYGQDFSFSVEITTLRNEVSKAFAVNRSNYTLT
jgi:hypothetical protein